MVGDAGGRGKKLDQAPSFLVYTKEAYASYVIKDGHLNGHMTDQMADNECSVVTPFTLLLHVLAKVNCVVPGELVHSVRGNKVPSDFQYMQFPRLVIKDPLVMDIADFELKSFELEWPPTQYPLMEEPGLSACCNP